MSKASRPTSGQRKASRPTRGQRKASRPATGQRKASRPATGQTLVFVGPTMSADIVHMLMPEAVVRPPAAVGDILRAAHDKRVARIAIIDGYFERMAAVWHKEILIALERGIEVWGAASMGALRAAELAPFGMRGVGIIYSRYRRGALRSDALVPRADLDLKLPHATADDEVAVAHLPAELGYRAVTDALVNIRCNLRAYVSGNNIQRASAERMIELARGRFYRERTWAQLIADARDAGLPARDVDFVEQAIKLDYKQTDAHNLLRAMRAAGKPARRKIRVPRTWALRQLERLML